MQEGENKKTSFYPDFFHSPVCNSRAFVYISALHPGILKRNRNHGRFKHIASARSLVLRQTVIFLRLILTSVHFEDFSYASLIPTVVPPA